MASNEGHIHWTGMDEETVNYLGQELRIMTEKTTAEEPDGALHIHADGFGGTPLFLPNSTSQSPQWDAIPGTSPVLQARQDGHYPTGYIRIRQA